MPWNFLTVPLQLNVHGGTLQVSALLPSGGKGLHWSSCEDDDTCFVLPTAVG
ncbi:unnamed protein product [Durusdinium trenchii]|uniref:Uncharacterized protein n=2 Tax=Durusdinium trenchii TaxID=1381693 RepID=A0ABP0L2Z5_9DINO